MSVGSSRTRSTLWPTHVTKFIETSTLWLGKIGLHVAPPVLRIALALPFFKSGLTKWDGFLTLSPSATFLFEELFKIHILGAEYPFPMPVVIAHLVALAEITLPVLLVLGLGTRLVALALLIMTGVIQLTVPDGWANFHLPWASMALAIIALGPGRLSLDSIIRGMANKHLRS